TRVIRILHKRTGQELLVPGVLSLWGADLRRAGFPGCDLRGAVLEGARLRGGRYGCGFGETLWPEGFDPKEHGMMLTVARFSALPGEPPRSTRRSPRGMTNSQSVANPAPSTHRRDPMMTLQRAVTLTLFLTALLLPPLASRVGAGTAARPR